MKAEDFWIRAISKGEFAKSLMFIGLQMMILQTHPRGNLLRHFCVDVTV